MSPVIVNGRRFAVRVCEAPTYRGYTACALMDRNELVICDDGSAWGLAENLIAAINEAHRLSLQTPASSISAPSPYRPQKVACVPAETTHGE